METKPRWYRKWDLDVSREVIEASVAKYSADPENYGKYRRKTPADYRIAGSCKILFHQILLSYSEIILLFRPTQNLRRLCASHSLVIDSRMVPL